MALKILSVVESAYRATLEEQDDPILWVNTAMKGAGGDIAVLLRGASVNYAVKGQNAAGLSFGGKEQTKPPKLDADVTRLVGKGVPVYVVEDDVGELGLERTDLVDGLKTVSRSGVAKLFGEFDQVWYW